jgi:serine/threonine protein kinase
MEAPLPIAPITVGDYTVGPLLGRGGMSEVYACAHPVHGDRLALKLLRDDADGAFRVEAATREVAHPNVVRVIDAGLDAATRRYFLVMERLDGPDLATHLARSPLDERTARTLFAQVAEGMHAVHAHGIVHRDLKPANVMLHAGAPRIVDFGIAKLLGENAALVTSRRIGTLGYMAPEQLVGGRIAPSVDVWALGIMLFEAVTGRLPFDGFTESYSPQLVETAPRVRSIAQVSPAYDALVAACLDADPTKRPPMAYIARALRGEVAVETTHDERVTQDIGAMPVSSPAVVEQRSPPSGSRPRTFAWGIGGGLVIAIVAIVAFAVNREDGPPVTKPSPAPIVEATETPAPPDAAPAITPPAITTPTATSAKAAPANPPVKRAKKRAKTSPRRETLD